MFFDNRVTRLLNVDIPIVQAPMGYIARPALVAAVANAGAVGSVPGSLGIEEVRADIRRTREPTDRPFGVNPVDEFAAIVHGLAAQYPSMS